MAHKGKRKSLTFGEKIDIIRHRDAGEGARVIGHSLGLNESSICTIYSEKNEVLNCLRAYGSSVIDNHRNVIDVLVKMERYLAV